MMRFVAGAVVGSALALMVPAIAAEVVGENSFLLRWTVVSSDGTEICRAPYVRPAFREIECGN